MTHAFFLAALLAIAPAAASAHEREAASGKLEPTQDPALATVRIKSHGASATIIATSAGRSWMLGCAHMLLDKSNKPDPRLVQGPFKIDGPTQPYAPRKLAEVRLLAFDANLDLSLLEIDNGPFHFVPVARAGHKPSRNLRSLGYDNMTWPVTNRAATILLSQGDTTFTLEKPWHGRSGGGLIDLDARCLIGVVQGYEVWPTTRGLYVSHDAVLRFLQRHFPQTPIKAPPAIPEQRHFYSGPTCPPAG